MDASVVASKVLLLISFIFIGLEFFYLQKQITSTKQKEKTYYYKIVLSCFVVSMAALFGVFFIV